MRLIHVLRRLATRVCTPAALERRIDPAFADWQNEYLDAVDRRRRWSSGWIHVMGMIGILKVVLLVVIEQWAHAVTHPDGETGASLVKAGAIFAIVVTLTTVALAWLPFDIMPKPTAADAGLLLYLVPQALPIALPVGVATAIVLGFGRRFSGRVVAVGLTWAAICSVLSFVTLAWWAPASNQAFRTRIVGFDIAKGDRELTLGELATRIDRIRASDPVAPARRLSVQYQTRWALSFTPVVLAAFALAVIRRIRRGMVLVSIALIGNVGFALLLIWTSNLAFRGVVPPSVAAWLPNLTFLGLTTIAMLRSIPRSTNAAS